MDLSVEMLVALNFSKHSGKIWLSFVGDELKQPQKHFGIHSSVLSGAFPVVSKV